MVNNYEKIKNLMHFEIEGDVYYVQVMQRAKDGFARDRIIRDYHIHNFDQFERDFWGDMVPMCNSCGARAMIRLNQRNTLDANIQTQIECLVAQLEVNRIMRKMIRTGKTTYKFPKLQSAQKFYSSALGKTCTEDSETKKWILDIDDAMVNTLDPLFQNVDAIADLFEKFIVGECAERNEDLLSSSFQARHPLGYVPVPQGSLLQPFRKAVQPRRVHHARCEHQPLHSGLIMKLVCSP